MVAAFSSGLERGNLQAGAWDKMNLDWLAEISLVCAAIPCGLFLTNLGVYRPIPRRRSSGKIGVSVLIPARDEELNIRSSVAAALANRPPGMEVEVIVLDDHSSDRTVEIVEEMARGDSRLRCEIAPPLPPGWCWWKTRGWWWKTPGLPNGRSRCWAGLTRNILRFRPRLSS